MKRIIKKILILTVALAMILTAIPFSGMDLSGLFKAEASIAKKESHKVFGDYIYDDETDEKIPGIRLIKYTGSEKNIVVPDQIDGKPVLSIGTECFEYEKTNPNIMNGDKFIPANPALKEVESIVLPDTIVRIDLEAFEGCENLTSINIPSSIKRLRPFIFSGCKSLKEITLPGKNISFDTGVFRNSYIEKINLTEGMTKIPGYFLEGSKVTSISIPSTVSTISENAFKRSNCKTVIFEGLSPLLDNLYSGLENFDFIDLTEYNYPRYLETVVFRYLPATIPNKGLYKIRYEKESGLWYMEYIGEKVSGTEFEDYFNYYVNENGEAILTEYTGPYSVVSIPKKVGFALPVAGIDRKTFAGTSVNKVVIPDTVKEIGNYAFYNCKSLEEVVLPDGITQIGAAVFYGCSSLKKINWPSSMNYVPPEMFFNCKSLSDFSIFKDIEIIGSSAFRGCTGLTVDDFGSKLREIGAGAFTTGDVSGDESRTVLITDTDLSENLEYIGCKAFLSIQSLTELTIPEKVCVIGEGAFEMTMLEKVEIKAPLKEIRDNVFGGTPLKSIPLPEGLEKIGGDAFAGTALEQITLPESLKYIGEYAFCESQLKSIDIPPLVSEIGEEAFSYTDIEKVVVPSAVKVIGKGAFYCCTHLKDITIENGVEEIGSYAFYRCAAKEITIPESIVKLGRNIISFSKIETVYYNAVNVITSSVASEIYNDHPFFDCNTLKKIVFGENVKSVPYHFSDSSYTLEEIVFSSGIEKIGFRAFYGCTALKKVSLPESLKTSGNIVFFGCSSLSEVVIPNGIEKLSDGFFASCTALNNITLPESFRELNSDVFYGCTALSEITIPEGLTSLYGTAFRGCTGIKTVNFNASACKFINPTESEVKGIYYSPFKCLTALETINLGANIKELPAFLFCGIESISEIELPSTVTDVGVGAFAFSSITSFKGSDNLESIEESAFYGCKSLESADFGNDIMIIGANAFTDCDKLTEIYIPDSVTNIEMEAFKNCPSLQSVRMSPNVDYIPREAFYNCTELSSFTWEADSKLVGRLAFGNCVKLTDFDFLNVEKLYVNSFLGSGVAVVQLGESVNEASPSPLTTIEVQSFKDCENLATLGIGGNVTTVKSQAFADCTNLETAVIADSVTEIAEDAFDGCDKLTIYCSEDSYAHTYAQTQGIKVSTFVIAPIPNQTYTGFEIKPEISVSLSGNNLNQNTDFGIAYANNINVGNADVTVTGKGDFRMYMSKANFTIVTKNIAQATVAPIAEQNYTGSPITPAVTITDGGNVLREGVDYTLTFSGNVDEGTAKVKIKGIGNYSGTAEAEFQIKSQSRIRQIMTALSGFANSFFARLKALITAIFR